MRFTGMITMMVLKADLTYLRHVYPGGLQLFKYLGPERHAEQQSLFDKDIVFTTYATVAAEKNNEQSPLRCIDWFRVVLDEGM
jgi:SNF2 family DNA or RNA helicase